MSRAGYDEIAEWYDAYITTGSQGSLFDDLVLPSVLQLSGEVQGLPVLDLACGQGVVSRRLALSGAHVVGVDLSAKLLEMARKYEDEKPMRIVYMQDDACTLNTIGDAVFAGVVCSMALMDIEGLESTFQAIWRVLAPGGWLVFSVTHPCFQTSVATWVENNQGRTYRQVGGYFDEGFWRSDNPSGVRSRVGAQHRTLSTYFNALVGARFSVERVLEPQAAGRLAADVPGYAEVPAVLVVRAIKVT